MGTSYSYTVFSGIIELIPALLLLFKRTRQLAAIIAMFVMTNVAMINFGFDISVKVYSCFLLLLSVIIALPGIKRIISLFIKNKSVNATEWKPKYNFRYGKLIYFLVKFFVIVIILIETLIIYFQANNFNDDTAKRPYLHGGYAITNYTINNDSIANKNRFKNIFIHRKGYFIFQNKYDEMKDYQLNYDIQNKKLILTDYDSSQIIFNYTYSEQDSILNLNGIVKNDTIYIEAKKIDLSKLPLFEKGFHWTIDDLE